MTDAGKSGTIANNGTFYAEKRGDGTFTGLLQTIPIPSRSRVQQDYKTSISGSSGSTDAITIAEDNKTAGVQTYKLDKADAQTFTNTKGNHASDRNHDGCPSVCCPGDFAGAAALYLFIRKSRRVKDKKSSSYQAGRNFIRLPQKKQQRQAKEENDDGRTKINPRNE